MTLEHQHKKTNVVVFLANEAAGEGQTLDGLFLCSFTFNPTEEIQTVAVCSQKAISKVPNENITLSRKSLVYSGNRGTVYCSKAQ